MLVPRVTQVTATAFLRSHVAPTYQHARLLLHGIHWLEWGQGLFWLAALIWLFVLVPTQRRLIAASEAGRKSGALPPEFERLSHRWRCEAGSPRCCRSSSPI